MLYTLYHYSVFCLQVTAFYFLAALTSGLSCPTGLLVPSILCGAAYGRLVSRVFFVRDQGRGGALSHMAQRQPTGPSAAGGD